MTTREVGAEAASPWVDSTGDVQWINATGIADDRIDRAAGRVAREVSRWMRDDVKQRPPSIFNRTGYVAPDSPYALMRAAKQAVENDDVVSGSCDVTEGLMFQGLKWESTESEEADIFNQIAGDLNLDEFVRQWHREEYTYSQCVVGIWWGRRSYTVRGKSEAGKKRKKKYELHCPIALTYLDPNKVVPLRPGFFGEDRLAWQATKDEYAKAVLGFLDDPILDTFTTGPVTLDEGEKEYLRSIGADPERLLGLNPAYVFRYCRTKMDYERFAPLRLKSIFPLLDLKQQLMEADRVALVGAVNYIILVKQGSEKEPAEQEELDNLKENFKVVAKLPVVIGDHRLSIEIITPDREYTLDTAKYDTLDRRIIGRCLGAMSIASDGQRNESTLTIARSIGRMLESRRHMMKRYLERHVARAIVEHPLNAGKFNAEPNLVFTPKNVQLDNDASMVQAILSLRQSNELSRESTLEYFGFDQLTEALRREFEEESGLDDTFQTRVPFSAAEGGDEDSSETPKVSGGRGGRPNGGGKSPNSVKGRVGNRTAKGNPSTKGDG